MTAQTGVPQRRWIAVWLVLFWPVGLYLLMKRINADKGALFNSGKTMMTASYVLLGLTVLIVIGAFSPHSSTSPNDTGGSSTGGALAAAAVFGLGAGVLNWYARQLKQRAARYRTYISLVVNQQQTSIDNIAAAAGTSIDVATKDLQRMIDQSYFPGAHLDIAQREIVLAQPAPVTVAVGAPTSLETRVAECSGCGANNRVAAGMASDCEYCGSPLQF